MDVFCDTSWDNLPDGVSNAQGHMIFLTGQQQSSLLSWISNKIKCKVVAKELIMKWKEPFILAVSLRRYIVTVIK